MTHSMSSVVTWITFGRYGAVLNCGMTGRDKKDRVDELLRQSAELRQRSERLAREAERLKREIAGSPPGERRVTERRKKPRAKGK